MTRRRMIFWVVGPLLLIALNFRRDVSRTLAKYEWEPVEKKTLHRGISNPGVMEAIRVFEIKSDVDEVVEKKMVQEGQAVKEGQPLVQLSRTRTQLEFEQRHNSTLSAEADFRKATRELAVQKKLLKSLAVSRSQVEDSEQALEKSKASFQISSQELRIAQKKLDSTLVRSPMNGVVLKDFTKIGMAISPGKEIITVGDISHFVVRAKVDELDIQQVSVGQPVEIIADAFPDRAMKGKVRSIATQAEREAFAKIEVLIDIANANGLALKHNLSVRINILTEDIPDAVSVSIKSILKKDGNAAWVLARNKINLVQKKKITLGKTAGERVQVISGLEPGEQVGTEKLTTKTP